MKKTKKAAKRFLAVLLAAVMIDTSIPQTALASAAEIVQDVSNENPENDPGEGDIEQTQPEAPETEPSEETVGEESVTTEEEPFEAEEPSVEENSLADDIFSIDEADFDERSLQSAGILSTGSAQGITWTLDENGQLVVEGTGELLWTSGTNRGKPVWYPRAGYEIKSVVLKSSGATDLTELFATSLYLTEVDLSGFDASKVKNMSKMFYNCGKLTSINLNGLDTGSVTNMSGMFQACSVLKELDLSGLNTGSVTNMSYIFASCDELTSLNLKGLNLSSVTNMSHMFDSCDNLTGVDMSGLDTGNVTDMSNMFYDCISLADVNLSGVNTGNVKNMNYMFQNCRSLTDINLSELKLSKVTDMQCLFYECRKLLDVDLSGADLGSVTNMYGMFGNCTKLNSVNFSNVNMAKAQSMQEMFKNCSSLTGVNFNGIITDSLEDINNMFSGCSSLTSVDLTGLDTAGVTNMSSLFISCTKLAEVNWGGIDTGMVTDISYMFFSCSELEEMPLTGLDLHNVDSMSYMFESCGKLKRIDLSGLNLEKVSSMNETFKDCSSLEDVSFGSSVKRNLQYMDKMFANCASLKALDLSSFDLNKMDSANWNKNTFSGCTNLMEIKTPFNLLPTINIGLPADSGSKWRLPDGTVITALPCELEESVVIDRYHIGVSLVGEHFVLKNSNGDIIENNEVLAVKGSTDEITVTIEPEEGYTFRSINQTGDCTVTVRPGTAANQYVISPADPQKGYQRDEELSVNMALVEKYSLHINYSSSGISDAIVVNGTSRTEKKPASVQVSNAEITSLYVKAAAASDGSIQVPVVTLYAPDQNGYYNYRTIDGQTDLDSLSDSEKILADKGYYIFRLGQLYNDSSVTIELRTLRLAQFTVSGFPGDVRIVRYTLDESGRIQERTCENPVRIEEGGTLYFQIEWSDTADASYQWCHPEISTSSDMTAEEYTLRDADGVEKNVWMLNVYKDVEVKVSLEPHKISLAYSEGDILDLNVTGEHAGLSADKKAIEVYSGGLPSVSFKLADSITLDGAYSNNGNVKVQETEGLYTLTMEGVADIRELSEITINTSDSQGRYLISDPELQLTMEMASASYTYTGKPVQPRIRRVTILLPGSGKPVSLREKTDYTVSYINNVHVGTASIVITAAENSKRYRGSVSFEFEITKAAAPAQQEIQTDLDAETAAGTMQQIDLTNLFTVDTAYEKGVKPTGFRLALNDSMCDYGGILKNAPALDGNILSCNIWGDADKYSDPAVVVLYGSYDDYKDAKLVLKIRLIQKDDVILSGAAFVADKVYDGTPVSLDIGGLSVATVAGTAPENPETFMQQIKDSFIYRYTGTGNTVYDSDQAPSEAGTYKVSVKISGENMDYRMDYTDIASFTVSKRPIELTADPVKLYIGDSAPAQYDFHVMGEGLAAGDVIYRQPVLSCPSLNMAALGEYAILIDTANLCIYNSNGEDVTGSYSISGKEGILSVVAPEPGSYTVIYDLSGRGDSIIRSGMEAGSLLTKPLDPEAEGYVFLDWYKDKTLNKKWNFETDIIQSNITLYAGWSEEVMEDEGLSLYIQEIVDQTYTGKAVKPVVAVYDGDGKTLLKSGKDYSVQYKNNTEADTGAKKFGNGEIPAGGIGVKQKDNTVDTSEGFNDKLAYVIITGKGNYTGTVCVNFHIKPADMTAADGKTDTPAKGFTLKCTDQFEAKPNKNGKIVNTLKYNKKSLVLGKDYILTVQKEDGTEVSLTQKGELPLNEGNYRLTISGQGNYTGFVTKELYVAPKAKLMKNAKVVYTKTVSDVNKEQLKNGIEQPDIRVTISGTPVSEENYTVTYSNNHAVGTATMTLTGKNGYVGSKSVTYKIKGIAFKEKEFQPVQLEDMLYNGTARTQNGVQLIPITGGDALKYGTDYTVSYKNNVKKGKASITFKANPESGYSGSFTKKFAIKAAGLGTEAVVRDGIREENGKLILTEAVPFHKGGVKPSGKYTLYLKSTGAALTEGKDFTVKYKDNKAVSQGKAYMLIKGKGNYDQTLTVYFDIGNASLYQLYQDGEVTVTASSVKTKIPHDDSGDDDDYDEESYSHGGYSAQSYSDDDEEREYRPSITVKDGKKKLVKDVDYEIVGYYNNMQSDVEEGWGIRPYAEIRGKGAYAGVSGEDEIITIPLSIYRYSISSDNVYVVFDEEYYTYTGSQVRPENFVVYYGKAADVAKARRNKETDEGVLTAEKPDPDDLEPGEEPEPAYGLTRLDPWSLGESGDYRIAGYGANVKPGSSGSVKLQGVGGFSGSATAKFKIVKKQIYVRDEWEDWEEE